MKRSKLSWMLAAILLAACTDDVREARKIGPIEAIFPTEIEIRNVETELPSKPAYSGDPLFSDSQEPAMSPTPNPSANDNPLVLSAKRDLAGRIIVDMADIELVEFEEVTWRDGSLGCPQPNMMYTQALVNGSRIILRVNKANYHYHSSADGEPFFCLNPQLPVDPTSPGYGDT